MISDILLKNKILQRIEEIKEEFKNTAEDFKVFLSEELVEFEVLLYGKKGLRYNIDRLDQLLYGDT